MTKETIYREALLKIFDHQMGGEDNDFHTLVLLKDIALHALNAGDRFKKKVTYKKQLILLKESLENITKRDEKHLMQLSALYFKNYSLQIKYNIAARKTFIDEIDFVLDRGGRGE